MNEAVPPVAAAPATDGGAGDEALMQAFAAGDAAAFDALYARYRGPVYRFFLRQLDRDEAEEAYQETWLSLVRACRRYRSQGSFRSYLFTIAHNVLIDGHRRAGRRPRTDTRQDPDSSAAQADTPDAVHRAQLAAALLAAIRRLPPAQREALAMREEAGMSYAEIAAATGTSVEGVKSRLRYAMNKLRSELAHHAEDV